MTGDTLSPAIGHFVDLFGEIGPRWGLPAQACRAHAFLYVQARPCSEPDIAAALGLDESALKEALAFLIDHRMIATAGPGLWRTSTDPWHALFDGLEARRQRELPPALARLRQCQTQARTEGGASRLAALQIAKMLRLVEDLAAIDQQAQRFSPQTLRGLLTMSGRAARFMERALGSRRGDRR